MVERAGNLQHARRVGSANSRRARQCDPESEVASVSAGWRSPLALAGVASADRAGQVAGAHEPRAHHTQLRRHFRPLGGRQGGDAAHHPPRRGRHRLRAAGVPRRLRPGVHPHRRQPHLLPSRQARRAGGAHAGQGLLLSGFPAINDQTARFYDIKEVARMRFNRRSTHLITVMPRDQYRYGYRLWIDDATAMPLKTQLCDADGNVIEQIVFANLRSARTSLTRPSAPALDRGLPVAAQRRRAAQGDGGRTRHGLERGPPAARISHDRAGRADHAGLARARRSPRLQRWAGLRVGVRRDDARRGHLGPGRRSWSRRV